MTRYISLDSIALVVSRIFFFRQIDIRTLSENTSPTISSNGRGDTAETSIAENQSLVTTLAATDPGWDKRSNGACGEDQLLFEVTNDNELRFVTPPDFEDLPDDGSTAGYQVTVEVADRTGGTDTQELMVPIPRTP